MKILGISAFYHDSAATLLVDGKIVASAQEERFTRIKHDKSYPKESIKFCLDFCKLSIDDIDYVCFYEKPFKKFDRLIKTHISFFPSGYRYFKESMIEWLSSKIFLKRQLLNELKKLSLNSNWKGKLVFSEHHLSHAASAFFPSPFEKAIVLTADGVGEWATTTVAIGEGNKLEIKKEIHFPHSLGLLYSAFTYYTGFKVNSGEYKLMGLAPYGEPKYVEKIKSNLIDIKTDGSFKLNQDYFNYATGLTMTNSKFDELFGQKPRDPSKDEITHFHMDIASSIQKVTEEVMLKLTKSLRDEFKIPNLCLAGGVALNCVANGKILENKIFDKVWVQPAAGDAGGSLGAALAFWHLEKNKERNISSTDDMKGSYLGPQYSDEEINNILNKIGAKFEFLDEEIIINKTVDDLKNGKAIGWFQGRMEFGPRALGARSILGDPRSEIMQKNLNLKVKYRESFRPFAPSVLREDLSEWFNINEDSPYMLMVSSINKNKKIEMNDEQKKLFGIEKLNIKRSEIPAVTHVDYSARIQTVHKETNPKYFKLIKKFKDITQCPILVNTSFNVRGEPIVNTPEDAYNCFMGTELDSLVIGNCYLDKKNQNKNYNNNYSDKFQLD